MAGFVVRDYAEAVSEVEHLCFCYIVFNVLTIYVLAASTVPSRFYSTADQVIRLNSINKTMSMQNVVNVVVIEEFQGKLFLFRPYISLSVDL